MANAPVKGRRRTVVFDLFHTLIDPEPLRPAGFDRVGGVVSTCAFDRSDFAEFWASTYVERETTTIDLLDLVGRHASSRCVTLDARQCARLDEIFGAAEDHAILEPDVRLVALLIELAAVMPVGVLSNCYEREVRSWPDSPYAPHVAAFGRSSRIGAMKPDRAAYAWIVDRLDADPATSIYVGNGGGDELDGARSAGFDAVVHCNAFDRLHDSVPVDEQRRRASQADISVDTLDGLCTALPALIG